MASALAGVTAYSVGGSVSSVDLAAAQCDRPAAVRQLAAARQIRSDTRALLSDLRLDNPADPRARVLSRQLSDLGFMPSQHDGWRQKAIDVSDQLTGTRDPKLRAVALTLARRGYGPTPADLLADPPPDQGGGQGEVLGQGTAPSLGGVVDSAAEAADGLLRPPAPAGPGAASTPSQRKRPSAEPALPQVCANGSAAPPAATPTTARQPAPTTPQPTTARLTPAPSSAPTGPEQRPAASVQDPIDDQSQPAPSSSDQASSSTSAPGSSATATPAPSATADPDRSGSGSGQPVDIDQARAAIQLLGELMQALGAGNGDQEATQLRDLLEQAINSGKPQLQPVGQRPTDSLDPAEPPTTGDPDRATSPTSEGEGGSGGGSGDWMPAADKLAEQASEAAATDPLARQLVDKLRDAGVDVPDQSGTSPSSSTPSSTEDGDQPDQPDNESTSPSSSTPDSTEDGDQPDQPDNESTSPSSSTPSSSTPDSTESADQPDDGSVPSAQDETPDADGEQPQDPAATEVPSSSQQGAGIEDATWDKLADCESSGDWSADTGNGYSGGLQFSPETWEAFGGAGDPASASREQQIAVATKVQAEQGWKAWPSCSKKLGL